MHMTLREIEAQAQRLEAAATLLRRIPQMLQADDSRPGARAVVTVLAKVCAVERWCRAEVGEILDEMQDQQIEAAPPRTAAAVDALRAAMRAAVDQMPDGPED
jgi:hypothetical protein